MGITEKVTDNLNKLGSTGKLGWGIWLSGIIIGMISLGLFPFIGISIICCLPAGIMVITGGTLVWVDGIGKK